jgi:hypothetical protein
MVAAKAYPISEVFWKSEYTNPHDHGFNRAGDAAERRRWTFYEAVKVRPERKSLAITDKKE